MKLEDHFFLNKEKLISPSPRDGRRISRSVFLSRRNFGYYLPIASYGTIFAAKWLGLKLWFQSDLLKVTKVWLLTVALLFLLFSTKCVIFCHSFTKLEMKDLLKVQQWWVERDSNLIPPQYRPNALTTTPCSPLAKKHKKPIEIFKDFFPDKF